MSKILLLSSGLKHAQEFTAPLLKRLEVYLSTQSHCVDVRNILTFDERTFLRIQSTDSWKSRDNDYEVARKNF